MIAAPSIAVEVVHQRATISLPAGPLANAIGAVSRTTGAAIGTADPAVLRRTIPAIHAHGSESKLMALIAKRAQMRAVDLGQDRWLLVQPPVRQAPPPLPPSGPDIVVTALKRDVALLDIPTSNVEIAGNSLAGFGRIPDTAALAGRIPTITATDWGSGREKLFLRGVADSSFTGPNPVLVGQYWGDQPLVMTAPDPDLRLYDVATIEVLEGPQDTLYGSGNLAGLVRVEPNSPSTVHLSGWLSAGISPTAHGGTGHDAEGMINVPVSDALAVRLVGYGSTDAGYIDDEGRELQDINQTRTIGGRATLRWRPVAGWTIDLRAIGQRIENRDAPYADKGAPPLSRASQVAQPSYDHILSGVISIAGSVGWGTLRATAGHVGQGYGDQSEVLQPLFSLLSISRDRISLWSNEVRLSGSSAARSWVIGASLDINHDHGNLAYGRSNSPPPLSATTNREREYTVYGELTQHIVAGLSMTAGARLSFERVSSSASELASPLRTLAGVSELVRFGPEGQIFDQDEHHTHLLPSIALTYRIDDRLSFFLRRASAERPGGLTSNDEVHTFRGDGVTAYEVGIREGQRTDALSFSLVAASTAWHDIQAELLGGTGLPFIENVGNGRILSIETSIVVRPAAGWELDASGFLAQNRLHPFADVATAGEADHIPDAAKNGAAVSLDRVTTLARHPWHIGLQFQYVGRSIFGIGPFLDAPQGGYGTLAAGTTLGLGPFKLQADATNLLDSRHNAFAVGTPFVGLYRQQITPLRPRTVRFGLKYDF